MHALDIVCSVVPPLVPVNLRLQVTVGSSGSAALTHRLSRLMPQAPAVSIYWQQRSSSEPHWLLLQEARPAGMPRCCLPGGAVVSTQTAKQLCW